METWKEFLHRLQFTADGEENERSDGNVKFHKSVTVCTGVKEPQVHLAVFSTQMNLIELIFLVLLGLDTSEEGRFYGFLKSAEEPQSWLKHKTSLEENGKSWPWIQEDGVALGYICLVF